MEHDNSLLLGPLQWKDDPLASKVAWSPMKGGGTNFKTHRLVIQGEDRALFMATKGYQLFSSIFLGTGLLTFIIGFWIEPTSSGGFNERIFLLLFSLPFFAIGVFLLRSAHKYVGFEFSQGYFVRGRRPRGNLFLAPKTKFYEKVPLNRIYALQFLSERLSDYSSYEFNLILNDGSRIHVLDHGGKSAMHQDIQTIAEMLGVKVWTK